MIDSSATAAVGEAAAKLEISRWGWAFRLQPERDYGIDAHAELIAGADRSGKLIALQIKAGQSYFGEPVDGGWVYRDGDRHLRYWLGHCLPVVLLLHDPDSGVTYWVHITPDAIEYTETEWKIVVPSSQVLGSGAVEAFTALAKSAPGAADDPLERSCAVLPPSVTRILNAAEPGQEAGALRLAAVLAAGRATAPMAARSMLSGEPSWMPAGKGRFEAAIAAYAGEHGHPGIAADAYARAASYSQPPDQRLLAYAALAAAESGDDGRARALLAQADGEGEPGLLAAVAAAVVGHVGRPGPVPVPDVLARATARARADEPACLAFLAAQAMHRREANAAVRFLEEGCKALPDSTTLMLQLADALKTRVSSGQSPVEAGDLRRMEELAQAALEQRRRWSGPSAEALATLIRRQFFAGAFAAAASLAAVMPRGRATEDEAEADEVVILGTHAAMSAGDRELALEIGSRAHPGHARAVVRALTDGPALPADEHARLWRDVLAGDPPPAESWVMALHRLACLGTWPLPGIDELHAAGIIDDMYRDILTARAKAGCGQLPAAVAMLRGHAARSPAAAEILVDVLEEAGSYDEALDEAARGFDRFGESILAHKRLNLLVLAGRPDDAAAEAQRLLARTDTAPELRQRTRKRLIIHYSCAGDWAAAEEQARAALGEFPGSAGFQWDLIDATLNQGRLQRAHDLLEQFSPEITTPGQARLWFSLHIHYGFRHDDVTRSLDLLDRWPDDAEFAGQVLIGLYAAEGLRTPDGVSVLPELEPVTVQRLQDRFTSYSTANPDGPIQPVAADPRQLLDMFRAQHTAMARNAQSITRHIRSGQATVGALAAFIRKPYARVLLQRGCGMIPAVTPDLGPFRAELDAAQSALDHAVVIETSAVIVATTLPGRWPQLRGAFTELRMTRDAWNDIQDARDVLRDPGTTFFLGYEPSGRARIDHGLTSDTHEQLSRRFAGIDHAMEDLTLIGTPDLGQLARFTFGGTDPALSPLAACAASGTTLWSDDAAIRSLAAQHGVPAFGTLALLHTLTETGRIADTMREDVLILARGYVTDVMLTAQELTSLAEEDHYLPGPAMLIISRPLYWAIPDAAQAQFLELAGTVNRHNPDCLIAWLRAACVGLAARHPEEPADHRAVALAEAVANTVEASNDIRTSLIDAATEAVSDTVEPVISGG
jgi:tetratricopeptide (TPR) repeat protein